MLANYSTLLTSFRLRAGSSSKNTYDILCIPIMLYIYLYIHS